MVVLSKNSQNPYKKSICLTSYFSCYGNLNNYRIIMRKVEISNFCCLIGDYKVNKILLLTDFIFTEMFIE